MSQTARMYGMRRAQGHSGRFSNIVMKAKKNDDDEPVAKSSKINLDDPEQI